MRGPPAFGRGGLSFPDPKPASVPYPTMNQTGVLPAHLNIAPHPTVAIASRERQFAPRTAGRCDGQLRVDVRGGGRELRFTDGGLH